MFNRLKSLFSSSEQPAKVRALDWVEHEGYAIAATPAKDAGGWRVSGIIEREIDGETKRHEFIRADICMSEEDATELSLNKARQIIREQGSRLFD